MSLFAEIFGIAAVDSAVKDSENQITFENFVVQAKRRHILVPNTDSGCEKNKVTGDDYIALYDALVDAKIIDKNTTKGSFWTWSGSYQISTTISLDANNLQNVLEKKQSPQITEITKCFSVDYSVLSKMLKTYKYDPRDQMDIMKEVVGGKLNRRKTKKHISLKRRRKHHQLTKSIKKRKR